jgi:hypothetical protein
MVVRNVAYVFEGRGLSALFSVDCWQEFRKKAWKIQLLGFNVKKALSENGWKSKSAKASAIGQLFVWAYRRRL